MVQQRIVGECGTLAQTISQRLKTLSEQGGVDPREARGLIKLISTVTDSEHGVRALEGFADRSVAARVGDIIHEYRLGSMLSGLKTQIISPVSGITMSQVRNVDDFVGSIFGRLLGKLTAEEAAELSAERSVRSAELTNGYMKIGEFIKVAARDEQHPFVSAGKMERASMTSPAAMEALNRISKGKDDMLTKALMTLSAVSGFSGRALAAGDNTVKMIVGRAEYASRMYTQNVKKGLPDHEARMIAREQADRMLEMRGNTRMHLTNALGMVRRGELDENSELKQILDRLNVNTVDDIEAAIDGIDAGVKAGLDATMTGKISNHNLIGTLGRIVSRAHNETAFVRLIAPFVRTPTNIASETYDRTLGTILGLSEASIRKSLRVAGIGDGDLSKSIFEMSRRLESPDARVRMRAIGQVSTAMVGMLGIAGLVSRTNEDGMPLVTGSGPPNARLKAVWKESGWQERSILVGDKYVSYDRLDPIAGALFGFTADVMTAMNFASDDGATHSEMEKLFYGVLMATAHNVTSKTWTTGLRKAAEVAADPSVSNLEKFTKSVAPAVVPSIVSNFNRLFNDPVLRDIRSVSDSVMARVPGLSETLDKRRNFMGEALAYTDTAGEAAWNTIMPFNVSKVKDNKLAKEFSMLNQGFSMPSRVIGGVDLADDEFRVGNQTAYDRMLEKSGTLKIKGRTLRQELRRIIGTKEYQRLDTEDIDGETNPRVEVLKKAINKYRSRARTELFKENPALAAEINKRAQARIQRRQGLGFQF